MADLFSCQKEFKEWFVNPVTGMIEGNHEYNENLIKRLHKVILRMKDILKGNNIVLNYFRNYLALELNIA